VARTPKRLLQRDTIQVSRISKGMSSSCLLNHFCRDRMDDDPDTIKNSIEKIDLHEVFSKETPRIQFNCIKRVVLLKDGFLSLCDQLRRYRKVVLEIHAFKKKNVSKCTLLATISYISLTQGFEKRNFKRV
jgi:hypothetical protein